MAAAAALEAASRGDAPRLASLLRTSPAIATDLLDENGCSTLQRAAADGHVEVIQLLLKHGADPNKQDHVHCNTAAHEAAWKGYSRCVAILAEGGADLSIRNSGGFAPLHLACQNGHNQSCREILLAGGSPDLQNNYGDTSLHTAARYGHAGVTRILISAQCRVSEQNKNGDTALHIAAAMGRRKLTRILLEAGCDKSLRNNQEETARDIATRKGLEEIISILNTPVAKAKKEKRDKSKERIIDETDGAKKKSKKKKNVTFDTAIPQVQWSPYGCHYYPDPKSFPKPKLNSLPTEPLKKGEQYYIDLAGHIKKGPAGPGYTCYCAPFFKHMEDRLHDDKKDLKRHIEKAHDRIDQKVADLEMITKGKISELTRFVAAERAMCKQRHEHLEQWLTRGMLYRASERVKKLDYSPKGSLDIQPMKRSKSLEVLDAHAEEWNKVNKIIKSFNQHAENYDSHGKEYCKSRSTEVLDEPSPSHRTKLPYKNSRSSDQLDSSSRISRSSHASPDRQNNMQNVTAEIHVKSNRISVSQSPVSLEVGYNEKYGCSSRQSHTKSPSLKASDSDGDRKSNKGPPVWKSQVLQKTSDDIRRKVLEKEMSANRNMDISNDGYVKFTKQPNYHTEITEPRRSVQEIVAQVEHQQRCRSPESITSPRQSVSPDMYETPITPANINLSPSILKMPQQPQRPAPILKDKPPKVKRFSLQNLIPFPTRKTFQAPPKDNENNSESSDEEDNPIRTSMQPGPMRNSNLLQTLPMPNFETVSKSPSPQIPPKSPNPNAYNVHQMIPKDAYFHDLPNRQFHPYRDLAGNYHQHPNYNETGLPNQMPRNRNPVYNETGVFDAMMQDHILREMERIPHSYGEHLTQDTEVEIANQNDNFRYYGNNQPMFQNFGGHPHGMMAPDHNLLHSRLQSLAINTHLTDIQSQVDRESHNDSGYSTKVYGSSQGPSPSLSGNVEHDHLSAQQMIPNGKPVRPHISASSLV